jgi:bacterioferritin-associated ferredoxin
MQRSKMGAERSREAANGRIRASNWADTYAVDNHSHLHSNMQVMYVCICNAVTERTIREAARTGVRTLAELSRRTGCADCCGSCADLAREIIEETHRTRTLDLPLVAIAA